MNTILKYILGLGIVFFFSCGGQLEVENPESLSPEQSLSEVAGFEGLLNTAYRRVHLFGWMGQNGIVNPEIMADNVDFNNRTGRFEANYVNAIRSHMGRWGLYVGINNLNTIIAQIDGLADLTADEVDLQQQIKGEAFLLRGLYYHEMAKVYGYEPGQEVNGFNLTVPLITTPTNTVSDAFNFQARATNTELYAQITSDLNASVGLLGDNAQAPFKATKASAQALLARVLLYAGDYSGAASNASAAITGSGVELISDRGAYFDSWFASPHPESVLEAEIRPTDWSTVDGANNSISTLSNNTSSSSQFILVGSPEMLADLDSDAGDIRDTIWTTLPDIPAGTRKCEKWQGEKGDFLENVPLIRISELYLIAAEANARGGNDSAAQGFLNTFRTARGTAESMASGQALVDLIMKERRVEFAMEGHRWFDLKRNGMDITKTASSGTPTLSYSDFRLLGVIPESELSLNELLVQNPGY